MDDNGGAIAALVRHTVQHPMVAVPHHARGNRITARTFARALQASADAAPPRTYACAVPLFWQTWGDDRVKGAWNLANEIQAKVRARWESASPDDRARLKAELEPCLRVDLNDVSPGTKLELAPVADIQEKYGVFRAFCQTTRFTLKDGEVVKTDANTLLPVLVRALTATPDRPAFSPHAHVLNQRPEEFLGSLVDLNAPGNQELTDVFHALMRQDPRARTLLGAAALMGMAQQIERGWQNYVVWGASILAAAGVGYLTGVQNKSTRSLLGLGADEPPHSAADKAALGITDSTSSGETDGLDPPVLSVLDDLTNGEKPSLGRKTFYDSATAFAVGTLTQLPAATLPYTNLPNGATIALAFPLNVLAAAGGGSGLAITLRAQYDHMLGAVAEKVTDELLGPMNQKEIAELVKLCQSIASGTQIMEKGGTWVLYSGIVAGLMQARNIDAGEAQRILLNLVEINSAMVGSNTASGSVADFLSNWLPKLGKTQEEKSDALTLLAIECAREGRNPTVEELRHCYINDGHEQIYQGAGRGLNDTVKGGIEIAELFFRKLLSRVTGGRVNPDILRNRIDFPTDNDPTEIEEHASESGAAPHTQAPPIVVSEHFDVDLERGDRIWHPSEQQGVELREMPPTPGAFPE
jgi:hypothetical protein